MRFDYLVDDEKLNNRATLLVMAADSIDDERLLGRLRDLSRSGRNFKVEVTYDIDDEEEHVMTVEFNGPEN